MSIPTDHSRQSGSGNEQQNPPSVRQVLKNKNFLLLWMAQLISQTILNAANYGLVALVSARPDGAILASLAVIAFNLPAIPFSAVAGVIVDKLNKRQVLWIGNLLRMFMSLVMFSWLVLNRSNIWPLFAFLYITSLIGQFFIPAEGSSIPLLVGERELMPALSLFNVTTTLSMALGFLILGRVVVAIFVPFSVHLGSLTLHVQPIDMLFLVIAVLYLVCVILICLIPPQAFSEEHLHKEGRQQSAKEMTVKQALQTFWIDLVGGWHIVRMDRLLFFSIVQLSVVGIIMQLIGALAGTFVKVILNQPAENMSLILAPAAIGLVGASIFMSRITVHVGKIRLTFIGLISLAIGFAIIPILHWTILWLDPKEGSSSPLLFWLIEILALILGAALASVNIPTQTIMQERAPEEGRARVLSLQYMLFSAGTIPVLLFAGTLTQLFGFNKTMLVVAFAILLFWFWGMRYLYRDKETTEEIQNIEHKQQQ